MWRRTISLLLMIACLFSCCLTVASAAEISDEANTVVFASDIVELEEDADGAYAVVTDGEGNIIEYLDVEVTVELLPVARSAEGNTYAVTYTTSSYKTDSGTASTTGVVATATVTWNDVLGTANTLVSVNGGWTVDGETLYDRKVAYGSKSLTGETYTETKTPYVNSFYYSPSNITGYTLYVKTSAKIKSTDKTITLYVQSKITT